MNGPEGHNTEQKEIRQKNRKCNTIYLIFPEENTLTSADVVTKYFSSKLKKKKKGSDVTPKFRVNNYTLHMHAVARLLLDACAFSTLILQHVLHEDDLSHASPGDQGSGRLDQTFLQFLPKASTPLATPIKKGAVKARKRNDDYVRMEQEMMPSQRRMQSKTCEDKCMHFIAHTSM